MSNKLYSAIANITAIISIILIIIAIIMLIDSFIGSPDDLTVIKFIGGFIATLQVLIITALISMAKNLGALNEFKRQINEFKRQTIQEIKDIKNKISA